MSRQFIVDILLPDNVVACVGAMFSLPSTVHVGELMKPKNRLGEKYIAVYN